MNFVLTAAAAASASEKYFMRVSLFAKTAHLNIDSIGAWATARRSDYKLWMANIRDSMHREAAVKTKYGSVRKKGIITIFVTCYRDVKCVVGCFRWPLRLERNRFPFQSNTTYSLLLKRIHLANICWFFELVALILPPILAPKLDSLCPKEDYFKLEVRQFLRPSWTEVRQLLEVK